jgi:hypothetical protein
MPLSPLFHFISLLPLSMPPLSFFIDAADFDIFISLMIIFRLSCRDMKTSSADSLIDDSFHTVSTFSIRFLSRQPFHGRFQRGLLLFMISSLDFL